MIEKRGAAEDPQVKSHWETIRSTREGPRPVFRASIVKRASGKRGRTTVSLGESRKGHIVTLGHSNDGVFAWVTLRQSSGRLTL
jgi:hypothetical protein